MFGQFFPKIANGVYDQFPFMKLPIFLFFFLIYIFLYWGEGVEKKVAPILGPIQWQLLVP